MFWLEFFLFIAFDTIETNLHIFYNQLKLWLSFENLNFHKVASFIIELSNDFLRGLAKQYLPKIQELVVDRGVGVMQGRSMFPQVNGVVASDEQMSL